MKALNKISQILAIIFGLGALVLFFMPFAKIATGDNTATLIAAQLGFGSKIDVAGTTYDMARSADILFCFWLTVLAALSSVFAFKSKSLRYASSALGLITAIYMLIVALSNATKFVDTRPLPEVTGVQYTGFAIIVAIALFVFAALAIAYLLIDDYLEALASNGEKRTIFQKVVHFIRDNKSEVKKIVWPGFRDVVKNTVIVLIMCLIIGLLIWGIDFGLGKLINLILGV